MSAVYTCYIYLVLYTCTIAWMCIYFSVHMDCVVSVFLFSRQADESEGAGEKDEAGIAKVPFFVPK